MFKTIPIIVMAVLCLNFSAKAQSKTNIKPLKIGDTIPEALWNLPLQVVNHPEGKQTITLNDYKGKLIILDFWATWCVNCIDALPKIQELQSKFSNQIQFLPVTFHNSYDVNYFLKNNKVGKTLILPMLTTDNLLLKYFPHKLISHLVWIDKNGILRAFTWSESATSDNINQVFTNIKLTWDMKNDVLRFDKTLPLLTFSDNGTQTPSKIYYSMFSRHLNGVNPTSDIVNDTLNQTSRVFMINVPIKTLCIRSWVGPLPKLNPKLVFFEGNSIKYKRPKNVTPNEWNINNTYCYEAVMPFPYSKEQFAKLLSEDLKRFMNVEGRVENREVKCLIFQPKTSQSQINKDDQTNHVSLLDFVGYLNEKAPLIPLGLIEGYKHHKMTPFSTKNIENLEEVQKYLLKNGVEVGFQDRELEVFTIKESK